MVLLELALAWNEDGVDLRKTAASVWPVRAFQRGRQCHRCSAPDPPQSLPARLSRR